MKLDKNVFTGRLASLASKPGHGIADDMTSVSNMRQRGVTLLEVALAVAATMGMIGLSAAFTRQEQVKQYRTLIASEHEMIMAASRSFVSQNYPLLQIELLEESMISPSAMKSYSIQDLVQKGYLPPVTSDQSIIGNLYGQDYALLLRAVNRSDTGTPQSTLTLVDIDPLSAGAINPPLIDLDPSNGEMDIEAILVTHGGTPMKRADGGEIVGLVGSSYAGFVDVTNQASGSYGSFTLDITPYSSLVTYPASGRLASIVSLSSFGILGGDASGGDGIIDAFRRCDGVDIGSIAYADCLDSNEVYTDIVMNVHDAGAGDVYPAMRGITVIDCAPDSVTTGATDIFSINCDQTNINGNLRVTASEIDLNNLNIQDDTVAFHGDAILDRRDIGGTMHNVMTPDTLLLDGVNNGQDMAEAIINTMVLASGGTIEKPTCPLNSDTGLQMDPRIYVYPAAYSEPFGRPIVGVRAYAVDAPTEWSVKLMGFVAQDYCVNDVNTAISTDIYPTSTHQGTPDWAPQVNPPGGAICSSWVNKDLTVEANGPAEVAIKQGDGKADAYELGADYGRVIAQTRCF